MPCAPSVSHGPTAVIIAVFEDEYLTSPIGGIYRFLVRWKGSADDSWITAEEFHQLAPELLGSYLQRTSTELSSFQPGGLNQLV